MKQASILIISIFLHISVARADSSCGGLFEISGSLTSKYKLYDPENIDDQIKVLRDGELETLKNANARKTNLPFFEDYVLYTVDRLAVYRDKKDNPEVTKIINEMGVEAFKKVAQRELTYEWVMEFSYRARSIFSGHLTPNFSNLEKRISAFPQDILIPTFARIDFKHFIEIEGKQYSFTAMREESEYVDGSKQKYDPEQNDYHDYQHYFLTHKNDLVLNPKHQYHQLWLSIHEIIKNKIEELPDNKKRYVEFIYFYLLHEEFGVRGHLLTAYLNQGRGTLSEAADSFLNYDLINDHYSGRADPGNIIRSEIYRRVIAPNDFKSAFPEKTNPQEILLVGIGEFLKILKEIEVESHKP